MAKRSASRQSEHDTKVKSIARRHDRNGWRVRADVPGYPTPDSIGGRRPRVPDVVARKRGATRIFEVETEETVDADRKQHATFRRSASQRTKTTFKLVVV